MTEQLSRTELKEFKVMIIKMLKELRRIDEHNKKFKPKSTVKRSSVQFSSAAQSCPTLCDPMDCSMPGLPVYHKLPEFTQTHVH